MYFVTDSRNTSIAVPGFDSIDDADQLCDQLNDEANSLIDSKRMRTAKDIRNPWVVEWLDSDDARFQ